VTSIGMAQAVVLPMGTSAAKSMLAHETTRALFANATDAMYMAWNINATRNSRAGRRSLPPYAVDEAVATAVFAS
jgi:hypothetical protein